MHGVKSSVSPPHIGLFFPKQKSHKFYFKFLIKFWQQLINIQTHKTVLGALYLYMYTYPHTHRLTEQSFISGSANVQGTTGSSRSSWLRDVNFTGVAAVGRGGDDILRGGLLARVLLLHAVTLVLG